MTEAAVRMVEEVFSSPFDAADLLVRWIIGQDAEGLPPSSGYVELRTSSGRQEFFDVDRRGEILPRARELDKSNDVWIGCCLRAREKGTADAALSASILWADLDGPVDALETFPLPPSLVIASGTPGHLQAFWALREPVDLTDAGARDDFARTMRGLQRAVASDPVADLPRVMRIPGTRNHKTLPARPVEVVSLDHRRRYDLSDFEQYLPDDNVTASTVELRPLPEPREVDISKLSLSPKMRSLITEGWTSESRYPSRSEADLAVVNALVRAGADDAAIRGIFEGFPIGEKYLEKENRSRYLARTIAKARKDEPARRVEPGPAEAIAEVIEGATVVEPPARFVPLDLRAALAADPEPTRFLRAPYLPEARRVWAVGPAESGKSIWSIWNAAGLTRQGFNVAYFSEENPLDEELRRLRGLRPDIDRLRFFHDCQLDLALSEDVVELIKVSEGCSLVVIDTLSACWSGDEGDNRAIAALDREVLAPIVREVGCTVLVLDHTGHPQAFVRRKGASAPRGASSKGQKADVVLEFRPRAEREFDIRVGKMRAGDGRKPADTLWRVVDTEDGRIDIEAVGATEDLKVAETAEAMVEAIRASEYLTTNQLRAAAKGIGAGKDTQTAAMQLLESEDPPRVRVARETVPTDKGRQQAKVWRPIEGELVPGG